MQIRILASIVMLSALGGCMTQPVAPAKTIVIPAGMDRLYDDYHYAPAVRIGDTVIVSGIPAGRGETYEARVRWMFERLATTLAAAGASMADVVDIQTFHTQPKDSASFDAEFARFQAVEKEFFPDLYPAATAVGTTALLAEGAPVEMRVVAVVGSGKGAHVQRASAPAK